jgi:hypothetical protein
VNVEEQLKSALGRVDAYPPSPDLFERVQRTLQEEEARQRRRRRGLALLAAGIAAVATWLALTATVEDGAPSWPGWALEVVVTLLAVALIALLGPALRRYGGAFLTAVAGGEATGRRFARLLDIAYYLVGAGYVFVTAAFDPDITMAAVGPDQLLRASRRLGGLALGLGVLHTVTILAMPVVGLVLADVRWRAARALAGSRRPPAPRTRAADRAALVVVVLLLAGLVIAVGLLVVGVVMVGLEA